MWARWVRVLGILLFAIAYGAALAVNLPSSEPILGYGLQNLLPGISFDRPVAIAFPPGETDSLYIAERRGRIMLIRDLAAPNPEVFLDVTESTDSNSGEAGLLGFVFHPDHKNNGRFFIFRTQYRHPDYFNTISEFRTGTNGLADPGTEQVLISQNDLFDTHNAGCLQFGPDGFLYIGVGFEGISGRERERQTIDEGLFGGILRIDVDLRPESVEPNDHPARKGNYRIPSDNPFLGITEFNGKPVDPAQVRTEFFAIGLRNPWRFSFHPVTGQLMCGDVGEGFWEEVNIVEKGGNYGWPFLEGSQNVLLTNAPANLRAPLYEYTHGPGLYEGRAIMGGVVSTGAKLEGLRGKYLFGDVRVGSIWALNLQEQPPSATWVTAQAGITTFGFDPRDGEVLVANLLSGTISKLVYRGAKDAGIPRFLSEVDAFSSLVSLEPNPDWVPYDINNEFWSDGALKSRWVSLTNSGGKFGFRETIPWETPSGAVFAKHFEIEMTNGVPSSRRRLETRFLVKTTNGIYGLSYRWSGSTDAELVPPQGMEEILEVYHGGTVIPQKWVYPSWQQCKTCHTADAGYVLGFNTLQLNRNVSQGGSVTNQLEWLRARDFFANSNDIEPTKLPRLSALSDTNAPLQHRVRSYFNSNCSQCHRGGEDTAGWSAAGTSWDARLVTPVESAKLVDAAPLYWGAPMKIIARRDIDNSFIFHRTKLSSPHEWFRMPPLGTTVADPRFVEALTNWIVRIPEDDWQSFNIGRAILEGSAEQYQDGFRLSGSGVGLSHDSIFLLAKPVSGSVIFAACFQESAISPQGEAGLMLRSTAEQGSPSAAIYTRGSELVFAVRRNASEVLQVIASTPSRTINWIKLIRDADRVTALYQASNGDWETLGTAQVDIEPRQLAGFFVSSGEVPAQFNTVGFSKYIMEGTNIQLVDSEEVGRAVLLEAVSCGFPERKDLILEVSSDLESWKKDPAVNASDISSTRKVMKAKKEIVDGESEFFRIVHP